MKESYQPNCLACFSKNISFTVERDGVGVYFCNDCELTFAQTPDCRTVDTDPAFHHGIDINFYSQLQKAKEILPRRIKAYENILGRNVSSVLEVGCATGAYAPVFMEMGINYLGIELDSNIADKARHRTNATIIHGNFLEINLDHNFDVFFSSQVLEHITEPINFLSKAASHVPSGLIHLDVPNHDSLSSTYRKFFSNDQYGFIQPPYHMIAYNQASLAKLLTNCKLNVKLLKPVSNNNPVWGQLITNNNFKNNLIFATTSLLKRGSLLTAVAVPFGR